MNKKKEWTKLILFNGPPRSGKDTAALWIENAYGVFHKELDPDTEKWLNSRGRSVQQGSVHFDRFSMPLKAAFAGMVAAPCDRYGNVQPYEGSKEAVIPWLGISYRQWQIKFSEEFMKQFGENIFGQLFVQRWNNKWTDKKPQVVVVPDSGFFKEAEPVIKHFGKENTLLVRVHRPGFTFSGDSRSYISGIGCDEIDIENDGTIDDFYSKVDSVVEAFMEH